MFARIVAATAFSAVAVAGYPAISSADINGNSDAKPLLIWSAGCDATASLEGITEKSGAVSIKQIVDGVPVNLGIGYSQQAKAGDTINITGPWQPYDSVITLQGFRAGYDDGASLVPVTPVTTSRRLAADQCPSVPAFNQ